MEEVGDAVSNLRETSREIPQTEELDSSSVEQQAGSDSKLENFTRQITQYLAAAEIASTDFPNAKKLQKLYPYPFTNFGHQVNFDIELFSKILWKVISEIQSGLPNQSAWRMITTHRVMGFLAFFSLPLIAIHPAFMAGFPIFLGASGYLREKYLKKHKDRIADIRAEAIEDLINDKFDPTLGNHIKVKDTVAKGIADVCQFYGNGQLGKDKHPLLLVASADHPFPGFGYCQIEEAISAPSEAGHWVEPNAFPSLESKITSNIRTRLMSNKSKDIQFGTVVCLHDSSVLMDSAFLDSEKRPVLWLGDDVVRKHLRMDGNASIRKYFAIQFFNSQYMNTTTIFIRPFLSGNSIAIHIALTTLGPPIFDYAYFQKVLGNYRKEKAERDKTKTFVGEEYSRKEKEGFLNKLDKLRIVKALMSGGEHFQVLPDLKALGRIDIEKYTDLSHFQAREYAQEFKGVVKETPVWPGALLHRFNYRESNSYTFTPDFFGRFESKAMVSSVYSEIFKSVIDTLQQLNFDVSAYKDEKGHYTINADKIDKLVVGEKINYNEAKQEKGSEEEAEAKE